MTRNRAVFASLLAALLVCLLTPSAAADAPPPQSDKHSTILPWGAFIRIVTGVAGAPPGPDHPDGTVLIGYSDRSRGPCIVEWDLTTASVVRNVPLSLPRIYADVSLARDGDTIVAVVGSGNGSGSTYPMQQAVVLGADLRAKRAIPLAIGRGANVAVRGSTAVVTYYARRHAGLALAVVFLDTTTGHRSAPLDIALPSSALDIGGYRASNTALLDDGSVIVAPGAPTPELVRVVGAPGVAPTIAARLPSEDLKAIAAAPGGGLIGLAPGTFIVFSGALEPETKTNVELRSRRLARRPATSEVVTDSGEYGSIGGPFVGAFRGRTLGVTNDVFWSYGRAVVLTACDECGEQMLTWFDPAAPHTP